LKNLHKDTRDRFHHTILDHGISEANISTTGEPLEYISILEAIIRISSTSRSCIRIDNTTSNHIIRDQVVGVHHTGFLPAKGTDPGLPE
jgi:hypothetical protein